MFKKLYVVPTVILFSLTRLPVKLLFKIFCHLEIRGQENLKDLPRGVIFVANHTSELDSIIMTLIFPWFSRHLPLFYVSREKSFYINSGWRQIIYGGFFFKLWGAYPAHSGHHDYERSLSDHVQIINDGHSVCMFPEGQRSFTGSIRNKIRGGAAFLALKTNRPIVPVAIDGSMRMTLSDFFLRKRKVLVTVGTPNYANKLFEDINNIRLDETCNDYRLATAKAMNNIAEILQKNYCHGN